MSEKSGRDGTSTDTSSQAASGVDVGRRETLRLATLAAALGAGLSVSFHSDPASAEGAQQLQLKFYREQQKGGGEAQLVYTATIPEDASKKLLEAPGGRLQLKCFSNELIGTSQMQIKIEQAKKASPAPAPAPAPAPSWDVRKNQKT